MVQHIRLLAFVLAVFSSYEWVTARTTPLNLKITTKSGVRNKTAPLLHGLFFEDINHSGDGGIYAELIRNRAFQGSDGTSDGASIPWAPTLKAWRPIGGAVLSLDHRNPLSDALKRVLKVEIPKTAVGEVGFLNEGWWGMDVKPQSYEVSFCLKASQPQDKKDITHITASLRSNITSEVFASSDIAFTANIPTTRYTQYHTILNPTKAAPNSNNTFALTFDGKKAAGKTFFFDLISLFPPTYKNRKNGLRKDLAQALKDLNPKFLRFPGGNNLEGISLNTRWQWKKNIGPLTNRPGRRANWGYFNSDGLGYLEFLEWCEDFEMEPLLTIFAGYALGAPGNPAATVPEDEMGFYIQEALDQLEYAMGDAKTTYWGKKRAEHGHLEPFSIKYVEIGNEDWFSDSYYWRWPMFLKALQAKYPDITYIASQAIENSPSGRNTTLPPGTMWDLHHYQTPQFFKDNFNYFDNWNEATGYKNVTIFIGEFSVMSRDSPRGVIWTHDEGRFAYPPMLAAIGEAIFALAMERAPNVVKLSSYAPLFQNFNGYQWTPDLIGFTADPAQTVLSTSYYQCKLFSTYRGTETLPIINTNGDFNPLWWASSIEIPRNKKGVERIFVKLVNSSKDKVPVTIELDRTVTQANATLLRNNDEYGFNSLNNQTAIHLHEVKVDVDRKGTKKVAWEVPSWSVVVLELR